MQKKPVEKATEIKAAVKATEEKAVAKVEETKVAVKASEEKTAEKVEEVKKAVKVATKKATKKTVKTDLVPEVYIQFDGHEDVVQDVVTRAKEAFIADGHKTTSIKSLQVYLKPEEKTAYYIINQKYAGKVNMF